MRIRAYVREKTKKEQKFSVFQKRSLNIYIHTNRSLNLYIHIYHSYTKPHDKTNFLTIGKTSFPSYKFTCISWLFWLHLFRISFYNRYCFHNYFPFVLLYLQFMYICVHFSLARCTFVATKVSCPPYQDGIDATLYEE